jgi:uncharacterized protein YaaW (UPF0174 family)
MRVLNLTGAMGGLTLGLLVGGPVAWAIGGVLIAANVATAIYTAADLDD